MFTDFDDPKVMVALICLGGMLIASLITNFVKTLIHSAEEDQEYPALRGTRRAGRRR